MHKIMYLITFFKQISKKLAFITCISLSLGKPWDFPVLHEGHEIIRGLPIDDRMSQNSKIYKLFIKSSLYTICTDQVRMC
jgi:hypothetical protein